MSTGRYIMRELRCDFPDCFVTEDDVGVSSRTVRKHARACGWRCDETGDWCPFHSDLRVSLDSLRHPSSTTDPTGRRPH